MNAFWGFGKTTVPPERKSALSYLIKHVKYAKVSVILACKYFDITVTTWKVRYTIFISKLTLSKNFEFVYKTQTNNFVAKDWS